MMRNTLLTLSALILVLVAFANSAQAGTVSGEVRYTDKVPTTSGFGDTRYLPVPYARIELYRKTGPEVTDAIMISSDNLGADGTFSFTVSNSLLGGNSDFQLRVYPDCDGGSTQPVRVLELDGVSVPVIFQGAAMVTDAAGDWTGVAGDIDTPSTLTVSEDNSGPFNIMFCISRAAERVALMEGGTFPDRVTVYWEPGSTTGTYTESTSQSIYLLGNPTSDTDEFDDDVIVHEYGHFISYNYTQEDSPGGYHYGEVRDLRLAWTEAWSGYFAAWMNTYTERELTGNPLLYRSVYIDTRVSGATHWDIEPPAAIGFPGLHANDEIAVQSALWDIFDPDNETWDSAFSFSGGKTGEDAVWDVYRSLQTLPSNNQITVEDFWFQWFDLGYGNAVTMDSIFNFHLDMRFYEDAFEDNDRRLDSTPLTDDGTTLNATFFPEDDEDWYSLAVIHDMQYTVSTSELVNGADTVVTVYNRTGDTVYGTNDNRHASTRESRVTFTPPYDQTVYIKVVQTPSRTYAELGGYKISAVEDGSGEPGDPAPGDGDGGGGGGGCFVATAAFGTMGAQNVRTLCSVRDNSLASSATGADITAYYYYVSPDIAEEMTSPIRALVRTFID